MTRTVMDIYDELAREALDARAKGRSLAALSLDLRDLGQHSASKVARSWAARQEAFADECDAMRDWIEQTVREVNHASA